MTERPFALSFRPRMTEWYRAFGKLRTGFDRLSPNGGDDLSLITEVSIEDAT